MARILIVDDAAFMRQMLKKIFTSQGHEICGEAASAKEAVTLFGQTKPDLVTMDIVMPMMEEMDGIGAVKEIIKLDPNARIIVVSAMAQHSLVVDAIQAGAKDFVIKPIQSNRLLEAVNNVLSVKLKT